MDAIDPNIPALRRLQREDRRMGALERVLAEVPARLRELDLDLKKLGDMLESERAKLEETRKFRANQGNLLSDEEEQIRNARAKLNAVKNARELGAAQRELDSTRRMAHARTEEISKIEAAIEATAQRIASMEQALDELRARADEERARLNEQAEQASAELAKVRSQRLRLTAKVSPELLKRYERVRERAGGVGFVAARERRCTACRMQIPHQHYVALRKGDAILACEHCGRLLYWAGHFGKGGEAGSDTKAVAAKVVGPTRRAAGD